MGDFFLFQFNKGISIFHLENFLSSFIFPDDQILIITIVFHFTKSYANQNKYLPFNNIGTGHIPI
jgi:hypothetical protein